MQDAGKASGVFQFGGKSAAGYHLQFVAGALDVIIGSGQQAGIDVQYFAGVGVEDVEQIFRRPMVDGKMVNIVAAACAK